MHFLNHRRGCAVVHRFPLTSGSHVHHGPWWPTEGPFHQFCPWDFGPPHRATVFRTLEKQVSAAWETASLFVRTMKRIYLMLHSWQILKCFWSGFFISEMKWNEMKWNFYGYEINFFSPTLYVGEYEHGFFATNSLVDETTVTVAVSTYYLFIPEICVQ